MFKAPAAANMTQMRAEMCLKYSAQKKKFINIMSSNWKYQQSTYTDLLAAIQQNIGDDCMWLSSDEIRYSLFANIAFEE